MTRVLTEAEAIDVVLSEREYQAVFAPAPHSKDRLLLLMEHYLLRARTDMLCPQMEEGREGSSIRKVGALAVKFISEFGAPMRVRKPGEARSAKTADPLAAVRDMLRLHDQNTCIHDDIKRGGSIWTICNQCGRKWADDEGGFKPYEDPPAIAAARRLLAGHPEPETSDLLREAWSDFEAACLTDGNDGWFPAPVVSACKAAFVRAWPQGQNAAIHAAMEAFAASGIPAERIRAMEDDTGAGNPHRQPTEPLDLKREAVALRQARYVLRDLHAKDRDCGYQKLAEACERAADRLVIEEQGEVAEMRRCIADMVAQIEGTRFGYWQGGLGYLEDKEIWDRAKFLAAGGHTLDVTR